MKLRILATGAFELPTGVQWRLVTEYDPDFAPQAILQEACHRIRKRQGILFELPGGEPRALIRVFSPCLRLKEEHLVRARVAGNAFFIGIKPSTSESTPVTRIEPNANGWDLGGATLEPWMLWGYPARPWTWAAPDTAGPAVLAIYVHRTAAEIKTWLRRFEPHGYEPVNEVEFYWLGQCSKRLWVEDGRLMFTSQCSPDPAWQSVDMTLLGSVCDGALGEDLSWDFIDDDYRTYIAVGHDVGSLREYLHVRGPGLERFAAGQETVSCRALRIFWALGVRLRATPLSELARNIRIRLPPGLLENWEQNPEVQAVLASKSRIRFTLSGTL